MKIFLMYNVSRKIFGILVSCFPLLLFAQNNPAFEENETFSSLRNELQSEYDDFRKEINAEYSDFLSKAWKEYRLFQGKSPDETPKPLSPVFSQEEKNERDVLVMVNEIVDRFPGRESVSVKKEEKDIWGNNVFGEESTFLQLHYFGADLRLNYQANPLNLPTVAESAIGKVWREMSNSRYALLLADMLRYKEEMKMNDWAYFLLVEKVAGRLSTLQSEDCRTVFQHFFLVQSGYDIRLARVDQFLVLLLPIREEVYARPFLKLEGKVYYAITKKELKAQSSIFTYQLPKKLIDKSFLSLAITEELLLPVQPKVYCIRIPGLEVKGEVNVNKIRFYQEYLSCELPVYARALPDQRLSKQLTASLSSQLAQHPFAEALNLLLSWVQSGFHYQTDGDQFGCEKPFFIDENFYYPACDCEDRSILFAYLVKQLWKKEVVLLDYPGHVATAVCMGEKEEVKGTYVQLNGKKYVVCDPTYINAEVGRVMPAYKTKRPKVIKL